MSRNAISANPEHYIFTIFWGSMPPDPLESLKKFFSRRLVAEYFFQDQLPPKQKILHRTLPAVNLKLPCWIWICHGEIEFDVVN